MKRLFIAVALVCSILCVNAREPTIRSGDYRDSPHRDGLFVLSPLIGWNEHTDHTPGRDATGGDWEYGLFMVYATPRVAVNNMLFFTAPTGVDVWGDLLFLNLYGDPDAVVTWNVGAGHLWHRISTDDGVADLDIEIDAPMVKAGALIRVKSRAITINPYLAYVWEDTSTKGVVRPAPFVTIPVDASESTQSILYGLTVKCRWRMAQVTLKYYLEDNLDRGKQYHVARARGMFMVTPNVGVAARAEYMEHSVSDDVSALVGPAFVF